MTVKKLLELLKDVNVCGENCAYRCEDIALKIYYLKDGELNEENFNHISSDLEFEYKLYKDRINPFLSMHVKEITSIESIGFNPKLTIKVVESNEENKDVTVEELLSLMQRIKISGLIGVKENRIGYCSYSSVVDSLAFNSNVKFLFNNKEYTYGSITLSNLTGESFNLLKNKHVDKICMINIKKVLFSYVFTIKIKDNEN